MYAFIVYIPQSHLEAVKSSIFEAGGGKIGNYDCCAWQTLGQGQFRPLAGSQPFIGEQGKIEHEPEYKVELVVEDALIKQVIAAMKQAHPYEEPAYQYYAINPQLP